LRGVPPQGYVLMTNHVHLRASAGEAGAISRTMQALGRRHVRAITSTTCPTSATTSGRNVPWVRRDSSPWSKGATPPGGDQVGGTAKLPSGFKRECSLTPFLF